MHTTIVKLKNGETCYGSIDLYRPAFGWFTLYGDSRKFYFEECLSVTTPNERVGINSPVEGENCDDMERAKRELDYGRRYGWTETDECGIVHKYPIEKFEFEKKYENNENKENKEV